MVGGGDTAAEEAIYLTKYGKHVRPPQAGASKHMRICPWLVCRAVPMFRAAARVQALIINVADAVTSMLPACCQCEMSHDAQAHASCPKWCLLAMQVHLLVRGERMRASKAMQDRVTAHNKVTIHYQTKIEDAFGDAKGLSGLHLLEGPDGGSPLT